MKFAFSATRKALLAALLASSGFAGTSVLAQEPGSGLDRLGRVEFSVSCSPEAQQKFNRAMALYHSFAWRHAIAAFEAVAEADPTCGMAHWGRAMSMLDNPFVWPSNLPPEKLDGVAAALDAAKAAGLNSEREKAYVEAVEAFVRDHGTRDHRTRVADFEQALGRVSAAYPEDTEASILHALATSANFDPTDKTYRNQMRAASILEPLFKAQPEHPGVAHYLIHTYDYPPIAKQGVEAAKSYAAIAPDAPHALHMPSHIFTRLGLWQDSIASNRASATAAGDATFDGHHASDYLVYSHLQLAQDDAARASMKQSLAMKPIDNFGAAYAYAAMPARLALEGGDWEAATSVVLPFADTYPWEKYPQAEAVNAFAKGIGAAQSGDAAVAREQQARLVALRDATKLPYWVEQIAIQADIVGALALCADGNQQDCIGALKQAAAREDATEKHVVTPGPILPARELLAETMLAINQPGEAFSEFEAVLAKEPNRYRAIAGAMQAADQAGDAEKGRAYADMLLQQASQADTKRNSLQEATELLARN
jgi:hypothetical protein